MQACSRSFLLHGPSPLRHGWSWRPWELGLQDQISLLISGAPSLCACPPLGLQVVSATLTLQAITLGLPRLARTGGPDRLHQHLQQAAQQQRLCEVLWVSGGVGASSSACGGARGTVVDTDELAIGGRAHARMHQRTDTGSGSA